MAEAGGYDHKAGGSATGATAGLTGAMLLDSMRQQTAGIRLRSAREAQGLSSIDVAASTRITLRHVLAIENGDYDVLPGRPYALGFARSYARVVGLEEKEIAALVRQELEALVPRPELRLIHQFEVGDPAKTPSQLVNWLALLLFVAIVGMGMVFWRSTYWPAADLPSLAAPEKSKPTSKSSAVASATAAAPSGAVVFTAMENAIWVKFYDGTGKQLLQKQLAKGESYVVPADAVEPKLWTGRPDALAITVGGRPVPRIADKEGIVKDVAVSAKAIVARVNVPPRPAATVSSAPANSTTTL